MSPIQLVFNAGPIHVDALLTCFNALLVHRDAFLIVFDAKTNRT